MNRRHFLTSVSAATLLPILTFVAQKTLRLKAEAVTRVVAVMRCLQMVQ